MLHTPYIPYIPHTPAHTHTHLHTTYLTHHTTHNCGARDCCLLQQVTPENIKRAEQLFEEMISRGIKPNITTLNTMLSVYTYGYRYYIHCLVLSQHPTSHTTHYTTKHMHIFNTRRCLTLLCAMLYVDCNKRKKNFTPCLTCMVWRETACHTAGWFKCTLSWVKSSKR